MLTLAQAMQIAKRSVQRITGQPVIAGAANTLEDCGISDDSQANVLIDSVTHEVVLFGHTISKSHLRSIDRKSTIRDMAQIIMAYSLPGDDPFEEPTELDPPSPAGDDTFEEPPG